MKFTISCISCVLTLQMLHIKFGKDWPSGFVKTIITDDRRLTTDTAGRITPAHSNLRTEDDDNTFTSYVNVIFLRTSSHKQ